MKKIFLSVLLTLTVLCGLLGFAACGGSEPKLIIAEHIITDEVKQYYVQGIETNGRAEVKEVEIPETYKDGKVVYIAGQAFQGCVSLESVVIPLSIAFMEGTPFKNCTAIKTITYKGTKDQWDNMSRYENWNENTGEYILVCTDGTFTKLESCATDKPLPDAN